MRKGKKAIGCEDFLDLRYLSQPGFSPDGEKIAVIVKQPLLETDGYDSKLYILHDEKVSALPQANVANYCWSATDRVIIAQPSTSPKTSCFCEVSLANEAVIDRFDVPLAQASIQALGDDKYLFMGRFDNNPEETDVAPGAVSVLTEIPYWGEFGLKYTSKTRKRLGIYDRKQKRWQYVTPPMFEVMRYDVSDGKIAIVGMEYQEKALRRYSLSYYDLATETLTVVIPQDEMHIYYGVPFGEALLFCGNGDSALEPYREDYDFHLYDLVEQSIQCIHPYEHNVGVNNASTDAKLGGGRVTKRVGERLYFLSTRDEDIGLYSIGPQGGMEEVDRKQGVILSFDVHGDKILTCAMYGERPAELYINGERISHFNDDWVDEHALMPSEVCNIKTSDGYDIRGWVIKPLNYVEGRRYPAILHIHGGPPVIFSDVLFYEHQLWAAEGYFVIYCNPRGSDGRGHDFRDLTMRHGDWDYQSLMDYLDGVLAQYPAIDAQRLGVTGGSYGGYMTNWIVGQTDRFAAAVTQRSISNWVTFEYTAIRGYWLSVHKHATTAGENPARLWDSSPLKYAERATTPTLIIHADNDHVCSLDQGLTMFAALKSAGCPARMCIFHGEDHELSRSGKPSNRIRRMREILRWFDQYIPKVESPTL